MHHSERVLGLADVEGTELVIRPDIPHGDVTDAEVRRFIGERLLRNRMALAVYDQLAIDESLTTSRIADLLSERGSYVSAVPSTWQQYARHFCEWLDYVDLAVYEPGEARLRRLEPGAEVRETQGAPGSAANCTDDPSSPVHTGSSHTRTGCGGST